MKRAIVVLFTMLITAPTFVAAQDYGVCYSVGRNSAQQNETILTGVFSLPASSEPASSDSRKAREEQLKRAFRSSLDRAGLHVGRTSLPCPVYEARLWGAETQAAAASALEHLRRLAQDKGDIITSFNFVPPAGGGVSDATLEETLAWLKNQVDNKAGWQLGSDRAWARWSGEGCSVQITWFANGQRAHRNDFNLADIRGASVADPSALASATVLIISRSGNAITSVDGGRESRYGAVDLQFFNDVPLARRVATALTHAAQRCSSARPRDVF